MILVYPMQIGRSIPEIIRALEALQTADSCKVSTPLNWYPGNPAIQHSPTTFDGLQKRQQEILENRNGMSWYLSFKDVSSCEKKSKIE